MKMDVERAVGFRFYPSEEELLCFYLRKKLNGTAPELIDTVIPVVSIYDYSPWQLPQVGGALCREDKEQWFFFTEMQEREGRGGRANRLTAIGYWKATGSPRDVYLQNRTRLIGRKRSMTFYQGRAPNGTKTCWKMNEYKLYQDPAPNSPDHHTQPQPQPQPQLNEELSLCRVYKTRSNGRFFDQEPLHHRRRHCTTTTTTTAVAIHQNINLPDVETQFNCDSDAQMLLDWLFDI